MGRFIGALLGPEHDREFGSYLAALQQKGGSAAPTVEEARKQYQELLLARVMLASN